MSERGVFAVDRGIWDHPLFESREPFTRREAWLWLLSAATWKMKTVFVDGKRVSLTRGQLAHSIRFLAEAWQWPKSNVARFLEALKTETMIGTDAGHGITIITICNYDKYQRVSLPDRDNIGTASGTKVGHDRDKEEDREYRESSVANATAAQAAAVNVDLFAAPKPDPVFTDAKHELWSEGPPILAGLGIREGRARQMIGRWMRDARDDAVAVLAAIQRAREHRVQDPIPWITRAIAAGHGPPSAGPRPRTIREQSQVNWHESLDKLGKFARSDPAAAGGGGGADAVPLLPARRPDG